MEYFRYDASGNIWYDKHNKVVYKNSELGLPVKITTFTSMPSNITLDDVNKEKDFANVEFVVDVAYDEAGAAAGGAVAGVAVGAGESAVGGGLAGGAYYDPNDKVMRERARWLKEYNPDEYSMLSHYAFDNESCDFGREGIGSDGLFRFSGARKLSTQLPSKIIVGPTRPLRVFPVYNKYGRLIYVGNRVIDGGQWAVYKAGRYLGAGNQAIY